MLFICLDHADGLYAQSVFCADVACLRCFALVKSTFFPRFFIVRRWRQHAASSVNSDIDVSRPCSHGLAVTLAGGRQPTRLSENSGRFISREI